jgi:hypothetical protein
MILTQVVELYYIPHIHYVFCMKLTGPIPTYHVHRIRILEPYSNPVRFSTSGVSCPQKASLEHLPPEYMSPGYVPVVNYRSNFLCAHKDAADVLCLFGHGG